MSKADEAAALNDILGKDASGRLRSANGVWYYPLPDVPYDSHVKLYAEIAAEIANKIYGRTVSAEDMARSIEERYAESGLVVEVQMEIDSYQDKMPVYRPVFEWLGFTDKPSDFDHDQMSHEVQNDLLGLGEKGAITSSGIIKNG